MPEMSSPQFTVRPANENDFDSILNLHQQNHLSNLEEAQRSNGFLTLQLETHHLATQLRGESLFVAYGDETGDLAGYVLSAPWDFYTQWPVFRTQTDRFPLTFGQHQLTLSNSFQYGPVCVAAPWRGRGVLNALFEAVQTRYRDEYPMGATFIDARNQRSLAGHRKLGFVPVDEWSANNNRYLTMAFATQ